MNDTFAAATQYLRRGMFVIPIPRGEKAPRIRNWPQLRINESNLRAHFSDGENIGVLLGTPSGLVDIDLDSLEARILAAEFLPMTGLVHGRHSSPRSHFWFRTSSIPKPQKFVDDAGNVLLEIRSEGQQTVVPPSTHPSGEAVVWESTGDPAETHDRELVASVSKLAAAALLARNWPKQGARHNASLALAGMLLRAGWTENYTSQFVAAVARAGGDEEAARRANNIFSTARKMASGNNVIGGVTLGTLVGESVVSRAREWLGLGRVALVENFPWAAPESLGNELSPVPNFDLELLPSSFRPLAYDVSDRMQTPLDYAAAASITALAGAAGRRAMIQPKVEDTSWQVTPNLWGAMVGSPGMMKSPVLQAITQPLYHIEATWRTEYESEAAGFETIKEQTELRNQAWREQFKACIKKGITPPIEPDKSLVFPQQKRLVLTDSTVEKLHEILVHNSAGVLVLRDELTGWLAEMDRQGRETERAFFLQAWNGNAPFTMDRIGRGSIHVPAVCVSLFGNIQPARLRAYLAEASEGGSGDDGLFQRFQILVWPDDPSSWRLVDRPPNNAALALGEKVYSSIAALSADDPIRLRFCPEAQQLFFAWLEELERKIRVAHFAPSVVSHYGKYRSLMPKLAGLFSLADAAANSDIAGGTLAMSLDHARQAAAFCEYLEAHARRAYACMTSPELWAARELGRHIKAGDLGITFTTRSVYQHGWTGLGGPERVRGALAQLEESSWVRRVEPSSPNGTGRPAEVWQVNPKVMQHAK